MIQLFDGLTHSNHGLGSIPLLLDSDRIHDGLFAMGFEKTFLDKCQYAYFWDFRRLLPALYDGSFFYGSAVTHPIIAASNAQAYLRGFAVFLCGLYWHQRELSFSPDQRQAIESALARDGWRFDGKHLLEIRKENIDEPRELSLVEQLVRNSAHDRKEIILHHFENGQRLFDEAKYHPCCGEWRSFLEEILRGIWRLTRLRRRNFATHAEAPSMSDLFVYLKKAGFFDADEEQAYRSGYGFLSAGGHPGIGEKDDAYLSQILALTFGHALLLKLESWYRSGCAHF